MGVRGKASLIDTPTGGATLGGKWKSRQTQDLGLPQIKCIEHGIQARSPRGFVANPLKLKAPMVTRRDLGCDRCSNKPVDNSFLQHK